MCQKDTNLGLGDVEAWVDQYGDLLYRYAIAQVRDPHVAEDLVQETFLAALEKRDAFQGRSKPTTWLIGILRNRIGTHWRKVGRERPESEFADDPDFARMFFDNRSHWKQGIPNISDPKDEVERQELLGIVSKCVSQLPMTLGAAFSMREIDGLDTAEVCACLGITETNFAVRMHRARLLLRRCLELNWLQS